MIRYIISDIRTKPVTNLPLLFLKQFCVKRDLCHTALAYCHLALWDRQFSRHFFSLSFELPFIYKLILCSLQVAFGTVVVRLVLVARRCVWNWYQLRAQCIMSIEITEYATEGFIKIFSKFMLSKNRVFYWPCWNMCILNIVDFLRKTTTIWWSNNILKATSVMNTSPVFFNFIDHFNRCL